MSIEKEKKFVAVPKSQVTRFLRLGGMSAGIAGKMLISASSGILTGKKTNFQDLLLTTKNMRNIVDQLSQLRGAALKLGQLLSLESGDFIPGPITKILADVRNDAYRMPPAQLKEVLIDAWGNNFLRNFESFDVNPIAAASIGQVHKCKTIKNEILAIKVQYPGVKESINSDIKNMGMLLKTSGLVPKTFPLRKLLKEAKYQLHQEVDYVSEGEYLKQFSKLLKENPYFDVPTFHSELSTHKTLAMDFKSGICIDKVSELNQNIKTLVIERLITLLFMEIF